MCIDTSVSSDNPRVSEHVHPINSVKNETRLSFGLESNMEELLLTRSLSMAHIPGTVSISDGSTKSTTQTKLIALLAMDKFQTVSGKGKDVLR